ncbi:hypothetical protein GF361_03510 [Candidatus Woesearchaeota archaeon]|nr:hypothetical protein [Candidatus Woesearchaeota archaeon]
MTEKDRLLQESLELLEDILGSNEGLCINEGYICIPCNVPLSKLNDKQIEKLHDSYISGIEPDYVFHMFSYFSPIDVYFTESVSDEEKKPVLDAMDIMLKECDMDEVIPVNVIDDAVSNDLFKPAYNADRDQYQFESIFRCMKLPPEKWNNKGVLVMADQDFYSGFHKDLNFIIGGTHLFGKDMAISLARFRDVDNQEAKMYADRMNLSTEGLEFPYEAIKQIAFHELAHLLAGRPDHFDVKDISEKRRKCALDWPNAVRRDLIISSIDRNNTGVFCDECKEEVKKLWEPENRGIKFEYEMNKSYFYNFTPHPNKIISSLKERDPRAVELVSKGMMDQIIGELTYHK